MIKLQKGALDCKEQILSQLEERTQQLAKEREESIRLAKEFKRDAEAAIEEEKNKVQQRRDKAKEHTNFLLSQMNEKSHLHGQPLVAGRFGHEQMSSVEKSINKDRLERACHSESLQLLFRNKQLQYRLAE